MTATEQHTSAQLSDVWSTGNWLGVRRHFGIEAFGINAWKGDEPGADVISEHDESGSGHQELYLVLDGHAEFTVGGETIDAPRGTLVFVRDPEARRGAKAKEGGTTVLAIGATPGKAFTVSGWEYSAEAFPLFEQGEYAKAKEILADAHERYPEGGGILYNLACAEARLGEHDAALAHLSQAVSRESQFAEYAKTDDDLVSIRDDPRFPG